MGTTFEPCHAVRDDGVIVGLLTYYDNGGWHFAHIDDYVSDARVLRQVAQKIDGLNSVGGTKMTDRKLTQQLRDAVRTTTDALNICRATDYHGDDQVIAAADARLAELARDARIDDPLDTPLPCDIHVGHVKLRKGAALCVL